jgi:hypothetical protein
VSFVFFVVDIHPPLLAKRVGFKTKAGAKPTPIFESAPSGRSGASSFSFM